LDYKFPERQKPALKQAGYRSRKPLRHPKSSTAPCFSAGCKAVSFHSKFEMTHDLGVLGLDERLPVKHNGVPRRVVSSSPWN
jgi:hypothetical protein